jgi:hypothetical protein
MSYVLRKISPINSGGNPFIPYTRYFDIDESKINQKVYRIFGDYDVDELLIPYIIKQMLNNIIYDTYYDEMDISYMLTYETSDGVDTSEKERFRDWISIKEAFVNATKEWEENRESEDEDEESDEEENDDEQEQDGNEKQSKTIE